MSRWQSLGRVGKVEFNYGVAAVLALLAGALVAVRLMFPEFRDELVFITLVIAGAVAAYSAYYARSNVQGQLRLNTVRRAFEIIDQTNSVEFTRIRRLLNIEIDHRKLGPSELYQRIMADFELATRVTVLLGVYEDVSIAIQAGYADEDVLFKSLHFPVTWAWDRFSTFTQELRRTNRDESLYSQLEKLATAWSAECSVLDPKTKLSQTNF
jgi:hypothetical protein